MNKIDFQSKALEYKSNIVGQGFQTQLMENRVCISIIGEIVEGSNFEGDNLFLNYEFQLPQHWHADIDELMEFDENTYDQVELDEWNRLRSVTHQTQAAMHKGDGGEMVSKIHFCFPFDLQLQVQEHIALHRFPILLFQINSIDSWDRNTVQGYGMVEVPHTPGFHELTVRTFRPNDDLYTKVFQFFLGGSIKIKEFQSLSNTLFTSNLEVESVLNRFSQNTESAGDIKVRFNVSIQRETYKKQMVAQYEKDKHMQQFQKLRETRRKQQESSQVQPLNLPTTTLIKTDTGYVNRFNNTKLPFQ